MISVARAHALKPLLDELDAKTDRAARIARDPVEAPRLFTAARDQEVAGLVAAAVAYGRVDLFKPRLFGLLAELGPSPADGVLALDGKRDAHRFAPFAYRFHLPADLLTLLLGAAEVIRAAGSLGARLGRGLDEHGDLQPALADFTRDLRTLGLRRLPKSAGQPRALDHLLPDAARGSACKRLLLYLRWMVRRDEVDLGTWSALIPRSRLVIPLDTHILRLSRLLGLTARKDASWRTASEVTAGLARLDPEDPVRYDFALCHFGMSACPARRTRAVCAACSLKGSCAAGRTLARTTIS